MYAFILKGLFCLFLLSQILLVWGRNYERHIKFGHLVCSLVVKIVLCTAFFVAIILSPDYQFGRLPLLIALYLASLFVSMMVFSLYTPCILEYYKPYKIVDIRRAVSLSGDGKVLDDVLLGNISEGPYSFVVRLDPNNIEDLKKMGYVEGKPFKKEVDVYVTSRQTYISDHIFYEATACLIK